MMGIETIKFLQNYSDVNARIQEYYFWLNKLRKLIHPNLPNYPEPIESYINAPDGTRIFIQEFIPNNCESIILCQHGNSIQGDLFYPLADYLTNNNIGLITVDNWGHGRSGPGRGIFNHPERMFPIYEAIINRYPEKLWHIHGESLGCIMFAWFLSQRTKKIPKIQSFILQVPPYRLRIDHIIRPFLSVLYWIIYLLRFLSFDRPFLPFKPDFHNPYYHAFHKIDQIDPIRAPKMAAVHLQSDVKLFRIFPKLVSQLRLPLLILQGTNDSILDPNGAKTILKITHRSPLRRIHLFQGSDHSLFNDKHAQSIYNEILTWLKRDFTK